MMVVAVLVGDGGGCCSLAYLLINCSRPFRLSSIKSSSKIPSSDLINDGNCFLNAFPGNDGTTIYNEEPHHFIQVQDFQKSY